MSEFTLINLRELAIKRIDAGVDLITPGPITIPMVKDYLEDLQDKLKYHEQTRIFETLMD